MIKPRPRASRPNADISAEGFEFAFSRRTYILGILNVTPDSFSDGGEFFDRETAIRHAVEMAGAGADIIDVGGESTRPGSEGVALDEEISRVVPVIEGIRRKTDIPISIDTRKSKVADAAIGAGASIVNDVSGLKYDSAMASVVAARAKAVILMHMKGSPGDMQNDPRYDDLMGEIIASLNESIGIAKRSGVAEDRIIIDPGIGFGKTAEHNLEIIDRLDELAVLGRPICIGVSRKSFIGKCLGRSTPDDRLAGTIAACVAAIMRGAGMIRVHDVKQARDAARVADSILQRKIS